MQSIRATYESLEFSGYIRPMCSYFFLTSHTQFLEVASLSSKTRSSGRDLLSVVSLVGCLSAFLLDGLREPRVSPSSLIFSLASTCTRTSVDTRARTYTDTGSCVHGVSSYISFEITFKPTGHDVTQSL